MLPQARRFRMIQERGKVSVFIAACAPSLAKSVTNHEIEYSDDIHDSHRGEQFGTVRAKLPNGAVAGVLNYSLHQKGIHIKNIEVHPEMRRQGIATKMLDKVRGSYPDHHLRWGGMTPEGSALRHSYSRIRKAIQRGGAHAPLFSEEATRNRRNALEEHLFQAGSILGHNRIPRLSQLPMEEIERRATKKYRASARLLHPKAYHHLLAARHLQAAETIANMLRGKKVRVLHKPKTNIPSGSLFDENLHPRAELVQFNPDTGKQIKPGQFAPKPGEHENRELVIADLLPWSAGKEVNTKMGPRFLRTAPPTEAFWELWRNQKERLRQVGLSVTRNQRGDWEVAWWGSIGQEEIERRAQAREESRAASADIDLPVPSGLDYLPYQKAGIKYGLSHKDVLIGDAPGLGKAQPLDAKILTPYGWLTMGEIKAGMQIIGKDGFPCDVLAVYPQGEKEVFRVSFSDGSSTECCDEHLWTVHTRDCRKRGGRYRTLNLNSIRNSITVPSGQVRYFIPMVEPVQFEEPDHLPVAPYLLGALLGDGGIKYRIYFSTLDADLISRLKMLLPTDVSLNFHSRCDWRIVGKSGVPNSLLNALRFLGVHGKGSHDKFIPNIYKFASVETRLSILQGLMDTDGWVTKDGHVGFSSASKQLSDDVAFLVQSLGGTARRGVKHPKGGNPAYTLTIAMPSGIVPFAIARKTEAYRPRQKYLPCRAIVKVESIGVKETQCIAVNSPDRLYVTDDFICTHNTIQAIGISNADPDIKKVLIIVPASLKINWMREWRKWDTKGMTVGIARQDWPKTDVIIVNYDVLKKWRDHIDREKLDMLISDESHYLKNPAAIRTRLVLGGKDKKTKEVIEAISARRKVFLTGTPIVNRPSELWTLVEALDPTGLGSNFFGYHKRYTNAHQVSIGRGKMAWDFSGASHLDELQDKLRERFMVRRLKEDVLKELPPKIRSVIEIPVEDGSVLKLIEKERDIYEQQEERLQELRAKADLADAAGNEEEYRDAISQLTAASQVAFTQMSQMRHEIALAKVPEVIAHVDDLLESVDKILIFAHHRDVVDKLMEHYGKQAVKIVGGMGEAQKQESVDRFQKDPSVKVFVGNIQAAGVGLTLTAASTVVFAELDWVPGNMSQAEDRAHRIGQTDTVLVHHLVYDGSLDSKIAKMLVEKQQVIDSALDTIHDKSAWKQDKDIQTIVLPGADENPETVKQGKDGVPDISVEDRQAIHDGLRILAGMDMDRARDINGIGFNKFDGTIGHSLASQSALSPKQAALGLKMVRKYRGQLPLHITSHLNLYEKVKKGFGAEG